MEQITTTTSRTALPAIPAHIIPQSEYVDMRDEIIDSIIRRNYGIFIDGASYWFEIEYDTGSDGEFMIRLTGSVLAKRDYYRGGSDGPGYDERIGHIRLGTFCHMAFLQPDLFGKVRVEPKLGRNTTKGMIGLIEWYWEQLGIAPEYDLRGMKMPELTRTLLDLEGRFADAGLQRVTEEDATKIDIIRKTFKTYGGGILPELLRLADAETSFYGVDPNTGLKVKIRPDAMLLEENVGANIIVSFKTTSSDTIEGFARDAARYKYDLSEGMYLDVASHITGRQFVGTIMVVLQTVEPWQVFVLWWSPEDLESGKYKYRQAMEVIAQCREKRSFPGYDARAEQGAHGIIQFDLPKYARLALPEQNIDENTNTTDNENTNTTDNE